MEKRRLYPVILAGGSGTRFWPLSRRDTPKQFLPLASDEPLVVETASRLFGLADPEDTYLVCGPPHAERLRDLLPTLSPRILVEPAPRSTAPAIGLAALQVAARDPSGILLVLPSDHAIGDLASFRKAIAVAARVAAEGALCTIGILPTRAETGFGYIEAGGPHPFESDALKVRAFVEKPDREKAEAYLESGRYLWNAGIFAFRADRILHALKKWAPEVWEVLEAIAAHVGGDGYEGAVEKWFPKAPSISIDYAVMERSDDLAVVPGSFGWSDLGSFPALDEVRERDEDGNVLEGDVLCIESEGNVALSQSGKKVVLLGCSDLVVVDAGDVVLVCPRDRAQEVGKAVDALAKEGDRHLL